MTSNNSYHRSAKKQTKYTKSALQNHLPRYSLKHRFKNNGKLILVFSGQSCNGVVDSTLLLRFIQFLQRLRRMNRLAGYIHTYYFPTAPRCCCTSINPLMFVITLFFKMILPLLKFMFFFFYICVSITLHL